MPPIISFFFVTLKIVCNASSTRGSAGSTLAPSVNETIARDLLVIGGDGRDTLELEGQGIFFEKVGPKLPAELVAQREALMARIAQM